MNSTRTLKTRVFPAVLAMAIAGALFFGVAPSRAAQDGNAGPLQLHMLDGTTATYRVQEQFAGINFPSEAVGTNNSVMGTVVLNPDGTVDSAKSKLTIDMKDFKSDQDNRDNYIRNRTLEVAKFPTAEFVPTKIQGIPTPLPATGQTGFQLTGNMTIHGVTKEMTWQGVATFVNDQIAGRAMSSFTFATFGLTKPTLARLLSVDDKIQMEISFRFKKG